MNSFKNPLTPLIVNPVNIDRPIQELQEAIAELLWVEKSFGRAYPSYKTDTAGRVSVYPEVWQGLDKDLLEVMPNDNLKSQSFFKVEDPINVLEYAPDGYSLMRATISVIFWFNLKEIDPTIDYRYIELLKGRAQRLLTNAPLSASSSIEIVRVYDTPGNIFRGYDLSQTPSHQLTNPYGGFRFELGLTYIEDCPETVYET